uniref:Uncharacterized protein n=1 Tax=uncultured soil bacterium TaxID=164851 RepID=E2D2M2_9BACT|nr:hypothetical protein [uncultured soil bacterium]
MNPPTPQPPAGPEDLHQAQLPEQPASSEVDKISLAAGPYPEPIDLYQAQLRERMARSELDRVRQAALAWRNGLAGLLAAVVGFSLIKGRSDIGELTSTASVAVGVILATALVVGTGAALALLYAAHGRPSVQRLKSATEVVLADHREALSAARALRRGIVLSLICGALLATAVGVTWYGPADPGSAKPAAVTAGR